MKDIKGRIDELEARKVELRKMVDQVNDQIQQLQQKGAAAVREYHGCEARIDELRQLLDEQEEPSDGER